jgi:hypothetical protein
MYMQLKIMHGVHMNELRICVRNAPSVPKRLWQRAVVQCPTFLGCRQVRIVVRVRDNCAPCDHVMSTSRTHTRRRLERRRWERGAPCRRVPGAQNGESLLSVALLQRNLRKTASWTER